MEAPYRLAKTNKLFLNNQGNGCANAQRLPRQPLLVLLLLS